MPAVTGYVAQAAYLLARQASSTTSSLPSSTTASQTSSSTAAATNGANNDQGGGGGNAATQNPLLFFVALGFGVVFTNLWIIVGVKYCFRYNYRNRRAAMDDGRADVAHNHQRRRREKKHMTIDEVNARFPMVKYKTWVAGRLDRGLPGAAGISRPSSLHDADGVVDSPKDADAAEPADARPLTAASRATAAREKTLPDNVSIPAAELEKVASHAESTDVPAADAAAPEGHAATAPSHDATSVEHDNDDAAEPEAHEDDATGHDAEHDTDDHMITDAVPPELCGTTGDTCAICIDNLEDDDDVRGLTCGHAFHAACIDQWLTTRRACCPLCKADYYVPKPRAPAPHAHDGSPAAGPSVAPAGSQAPRSYAERHRHRIRLVAGTGSSPIYRRPTRAGRRSGGFLTSIGAPAAWDDMTLRQLTAHGAPLAAVNPRNWTRRGRLNETPAAADVPPQPSVSGEPTPSFSSRLLRRPWRRARATVATTPTPSQLELGQVDNPATQPDSADGQSPTAN